MSIRLLTNGLLDSKFGMRRVSNAGLGLASGDHANAVSIEPKDRIVLAGGEVNRFTIERFRG
jgi:hypothetical protein